MRQRRRVAAPRANIQADAKNFTFSLPFLYRFLILRRSSTQRRKDAKVTRLGEDGCFGWRLESRRNRQTGMSALRGMGASTVKERPKAFGVLRGFGVAYFSNLISQRIKRSKFNLALFVIGCRENRTVILIPVRRAARTRNSLSRPFSTQGLVRR
jgi:hypothetical protein